MKTPEQYKNEILERFKPYLKDGALDYTQNLAYQMDEWANLKMKDIIDMKHSVNVKYKLWLADSILNLELVQVAINHADSNEGRVLLKVYNQPKP